MNSTKITFVIPSRNNLEFLQLAYKSIRNLETKHEILVLNDASTDGTQEWIDSLKDEDLITHHNPGPDRIGIVGMFDKGIEMARTDIIMAFHSDMVAAPDLDKHVLKHLKRGTVVSATRVEPPLHPDGPEKMLVDFGIEVEDFDYDKFCNWVKGPVDSTGGYQPKHDKLVTEGIFAPWCMYKEDFLAIGGHDELFAPQSKEDSDLFNRFVLNGYKVLQTWEGLVYHFTSRGSRFNKHQEGVFVSRNATSPSAEWVYTSSKNMKNFIRKWGTMVQHDVFMKPIISPKYDVTFIVDNLSYQGLEDIEPWCSTLYYSSGSHHEITGADAEKYIWEHQPHTTIDLSSKIKHMSEINWEELDKKGVILNFDFMEFGTSQQNVNVITQLGQIIHSTGETGEFEVGCFKIKINSLEKINDKLIVNKNKK